VQITWCLIDRMRPSWSGDQVDPEVVEVRTAWGSVAQEGVRVYRINGKARPIAGPAWLANVRSCAF
jgi:hypothetical protein